MTLALPVLTSEPPVGVDDPYHSSLHCGRCQVLGERLEAQAEEVRRLLQAIESVLCPRPRADLVICDEPLSLPVAPVHVHGGPSTSRSSLPLGHREFEVLRLMAQGATNDRVACKLGISPGTVKTHVKNILRKLDASNRAEAVYRLVGAESQLSH